MGEKDKGDVSHKSFLSVSKFVFKVRMDLPSIISNVKTGDTC